MNEHSVDKTRLLEMIHTARAQWDALIAEVPEAWMNEPAMGQEWSVKDVIAHIAWGERESCGVIDAHALVGSELWRLSEDERNAAVFERNRGRDARDILAESGQVFQRYVAAIDTLTEEDLHDPTQWRGMPNGWLPWRILYDPTHYAVHARSIRAWLERQKSDRPR